MTKEQSISFFEQCRPGFFTKHDFSWMPEEAVYEEMLLPLKQFDENALTIPVPDGVTFGFYTGDREALLRAVAEVDTEWPKYFTENERIYCAMIGDKIASFCMLGGMGEPVIDGKRLRVGGPGCVGTVPRFRRKGIGLKMIQKATAILRDEGYDLSYIHYTGVAKWYAKLGYETVLCWNKHGIL